MSSSNPGTRSWIVFGCARERTRADLDQVAEFLWWSKGVVN
jgi:hypothetical protein